MLIFFDIVVTAKGFKYDPFECQLADFPAGYKLFAHINSTRNDVYLYGVYSDLFTSKSF